MATRYFAKVHAQFEAVHCWNEAPDSEYYLARAHRHMFHVTVWIEQFHSDRDIEYYNFKKWLQSEVEAMEKPMNFSCEMYSDEIARRIRVKHAKNALRIEVLEDNAEGAYCEYDT